MEAGSGTPRNREPDSRTGRLQHKENRSAFEGAQKIVKIYDFLYD